MKLEVGGTLGHLVRAAGYVLAAMAFFHMGRVLDKQHLWMVGLKYPVIWFCSIMALTLLLIGGLCLLAGRPARRLPWWLIAAAWLIVSVTLLFGLIAEDYNAISSYERTIGKFAKDLIFRGHWDNDLAYPMRPALEWFGFVMVFGLTLLLARFSGIGRPSEEELDDLRRRGELRDLKERP
jgi:hypothetical protein